METDYPEILEDLADRIARVLIERAGIDAAVARQVGREVAEHVRQHWGGSQIYIPKGEAYAVSERDQAIFERFNGTNVTELARLHDLSERQIRAIVKRVKAFVRSRYQMSLFPKKE